MPQPAYDMTIRPSLRRLILAPLTQISTIPPTTKTIRKVSYDEGFEGKQRWCHTESLPEAGR